MRKLANDGAHEVPKHAGDLITSGVYIWLQGTYSIKHIKCLKLGNSLNISSITILMNTCNLLPRFKNFNVYFTEHVYNFTSVT
jgi:hypothetical protein